MRLSDALRDAEGRISPCPVVDARAALSAANRTELDAALADPLVPSPTLALALADLAVRVAAGDIRNHRTGDCPCVTQGA